MEKLLLISEEDLRNWLSQEIKQMLNTYFSERDRVQQETPEEFVSRKVVAKAFDITVVTLHDWTKRGLPVHKQRGRVYFLMSEVREYIRLNKSKGRF